MTKRSINLYFSIEPKFLIILLLASSLLFGHNNLYSQELEEIIQKVENTLSSPKSDSLDLTWSLEERMEHYKIPAVSIAVISNYELHWSKAYGYADKEKKILATTKTLFQAASISKSLNSLGLLSWVEQNQINLEDDFSDHLSSWKLKSRKKSNGEKITISNLLSHTSGLSGHGFDGYGEEDKLPRTIQILNGKKPCNSKRVESKSEPNLEFKYSGGGITITQLILEESSGSSYDKYMKEHILNPLGMTKSTFNQQVHNNDTQKASAYWVSGAQLDGKYRRYPEMAAAGLWTNPAELSHFIIEIQKSLRVFGYFCGK
ncbi:MAG: serine hydrolase domain-containing protein [Bacteroidota bacterium]